MRISRFAWWLIPLAVVAALCLAFPPFEFRSRADIEMARAAAQFSPRDFVQKFWREHLVPSLSRAEDASTVLAAIARNPVDAGQRHGRTVGIGGDCLFYLRGSGQVVSVSDYEVRLAVAGETVDVVIPLGLVFGNAVRDATGLLEPSTFPNAQQFNDIAAELNAIVEMQVLPELKRIAVVGARIAFVGCAELDEAVARSRPLELIPLSVQREAQ